MFPAKIIPAVFTSPLAPVLYSSPALNVTQEQEGMILKVISIISADSAFARKGEVALRAILAGGVNGGLVPEITLLNPNTKPVGSPSFTLIVEGDAFDSGSKIYVNGNVQPTTFVSNTTLRMEVSLASILEPTVLSVAVVSGLGAVSNPMDFTVTAAV